MNSFSSATARVASILVLGVAAGCVDASGTSDSDSEDVGSASSAIDPLIIKLTERDSVTSAGGQAFGGKSITPQISKDGRFVVFASDASNLVAGDTNARRDVFIHDRTTGETTRVSLTDDEQQPNGDSFDPVVSGDGRFVAFASLASNMLPSDPILTQQVYMRDRQLNATRLISTPTIGLPNGPSGAPSITADGSRIAYESDATNIVSGDTNGVTDVFVRFLSTGGSQRVSVSSGGSQANGPSFAPKIAADQPEFVVFATEATNLGGVDINGQSDVYRRSTVSLQTILISRAPSPLGGFVFTGNGPSSEPVISNDGNLVAYTSSASNLVTGDAAGFDDIFMRDVSAATTTRLSVGLNGVEANDDSFAPSIDGDMVAFASFASNLNVLDTDFQIDIFIKSALTPNLILASVSNDDLPSNGVSNAPSIRKGGSLLPITYDVAFQSTATNLVTGDTNGETDIFVRTVKKP